MNELISAIHALGSFVTEDLVAWNSKISSLCDAEPFGIKPATKRALLDLLQAIETDYPDL